MHTKREKGGKTEKRGSENKGQGETNENESFPRPRILEQNVSYTE